MSHLHTQERTPEEDTELRLRSLEEHDYALVRAAEAAGGRVGNVAGYTVILNPEALGLEAPALDNEQPSLSLPRIYRRTVYLPMEDRTLSPRAFTDPWRKTPEKAAAFLAKCTRDPELPWFFVVETKDHRATGKTEPLALDAIGATPGDTVRAVIIACDNEQLAEQIAEEQHDSLPWSEDLKLGSTGRLPFGWHGQKLTDEERYARDVQARIDRIEKRKRIEKVTQQMLKAVG
jgi:hypothetical protein